MIAVTVGFANGIDFKLDRFVKNKALIFVNVIPGNGNRNHSRISQGVLVFFNSVAIEFFAVSFDNNFKFAEGVLKFIIVPVVTPVPVKYIGDPALPASSSAGPMVVVIIPVTLVSIMRKGGVIDFIFAFGKRNFAGKLLQIVTPFRLCFSLR